MKYIKQINPNRFCFIYGLIACAVICIWNLYQKYTIFSRPQYKIFNLGMPRSGSTSLAFFLSCAGYKDVSHWECGFSYLNYKKYKCGECVMSASRTNTHLDDKCGYHFAYTQLDYEEESCAFPQITHLGYLDEAYPNSKFILLRRDKDAWLTSVKRWRRNMHVRILRCMYITNIINIPGSLLNHTNWEEIYHSVNGDKILKDVLIVHEQNIIEKFRNRPNDFFVANLTDESIGLKLSRFLNIQDFRTSKYSCWGKYNHFDSKLGV